MGGAGEVAGLEPGEMAEATVTRLSPAARQRGRQRSQSDDRHARLFQKLERPAKGMVRRAFGTTFSDDELDDLYSGAWLSTLAALERKPRELSDEEFRRYLMTAVANQ